MAKLESVLKKPVRTEDKHPRRAIEWIHYSKLIRSAYQFYSEDSEEVIQLAELIVLDGSVLQNLLARKIDADEYEIIAGHKRTLACKYLVEMKGLKEYAFLPVVLVNVSDVRARWQCMSTNHHHDKTQYEIMKEIEDMKYILENYPEEFPDVNQNGRMVDRLARELNLSRSVVSDYQAISHNLVEEGKAAFKENVIDKSAAVALASLPEPEQKKLLEEGNVTHKNVKEYKKTMQPPEEKAAAEEKPEQLPGQMMIKNTAMELAEEEPQEDREKISLSRESYKTWDIICTNPFADETFYQLELLSGKKIIVRNFCCSYGVDGEAENYYLWEMGQYLADCEVSREQLEKVVSKECAG